MGTLRELPLFPLNTVLFPGMPLYLHIFEPRYKLMIAQCIRDQQPFGVVLIKSGQEVGPGAEIHEIGTAALVTKVRHLGGGQMNIAAVGQSRFRIVSTHERNPYLTGMVEDFPLATIPPDQDDQPDLAPLVKGVVPLVRRYLSIFAKVGEVEFKIEQLPHDPVTLAFLAAVILNVPNPDKQALLDVPDLTTLLRIERAMLAREVRILQHLIENGPRWRDDPDVFSPN